MGVGVGVDVEVEGDALAGEVPLEQRAPSGSTGRPPAGAAGVGSGRSSLERQVAGDARSRPDAETADVGLLAPRARGPRSAQPAL